MIKKYMKHIDKFKNKKEYEKYIELLKFKKLLYENGIFSKGQYIEMVLKGSKYE